MMAELFAACGSEHKRMAKFPAGTHNETWACSQYYATIRYFLEEVRHLFATSVLNKRPLLSVCSSGGQDPPVLYLSRGRPGSRARRPPGQLPAAQLLRRRRASSHLMMRPNEKQNSIRSPEFRGNFRLIFSFLFRDPVRFVLSSPNLSETIDCYKFKEDSASQKVPVL